jgi:tRNA A37 methylthiotransferase MiaB
MTTNDKVAPYFDLSLQHVSQPLLRGMKRPGNTEKHLALIRRIRELAPEAALRSSFIVGFPGETEAQTDELENFLAQANLDWAGFFPYSAEPGTPAAEMDEQVDREVTMTRLRRLTSVQEEVTAGANARWLGLADEVLVDQVEDGVPIARSYRHAPEIDGVVRLDGGKPGEWRRVEYVGVYGPDMEATVL